MERPITTLFMLMSLDGKISTSDIDKFDYDKDIPQLPIASKGLYQYYDLEKEQDMCTFITGRVLSKVGWNRKVVSDSLSKVSFVIYDNQWLTESGVYNLCNSLNKVVIVTSEKNHPAHSVDKENLTVLRCGTENLSELFSYLKRGLGIDRITIQSGGRMNGVLFRKKLIDKINLVIAPIVVGGSSVSSLVDGAPISGLNDLSELKLVNTTVLNDGYLQLKYDVVK